MKPRSLWKAICWLSGENSGALSSAVDPAVRLRGLLPLAFITQISGLPARLLWKAMLLPSADQDGCESLLRVAPWLFDRLVSPVPSTLIVNTSKFLGAP